MYQNPPSITAAASVVGKKEGEGPLGRCFDMVNEDTTFGEKTWEKAESRMQQEAVSRVLTKADLSAGQIDYVFAGDLLNQCVGSCYGLKELGIPFFGLFGACSTMAEGLMLASMTVDGGFANHCMALTSSHFCSAERQFRLPLEYGGQRPPTSQWTVTGSGAVIVSAEGQGPFVKQVHPGIPLDMGIKDANNMGAAMAPSAAATIKGFLEDTGTKPSDYDLIATGDLSEVGSGILLDLLKNDGIDLTGVQNDCGLMIFDRKKQDVHAGASGCGCSAVVLAGFLLEELKAGRMHDVLFIGTGALMSPTSMQQGEAIVGIAHLVHISTKK